MPVVFCLVVSKLYILTYDHIPKQNVILSIARVSSCTEIKQLHTILQRINDANEPTFRFDSCLSCRLTVLIVADL